MKGKRFKDKLLAPDRIKDIYSNGIYIITHLSKPNYYYIGSTNRNKHKTPNRNGFYARFSSHEQELFKNKHSNKFLQNIYNKYGIDGLRFDILEIIQDQTNSYVIDRETYYINFFINNSKIKLINTLLIPKNINPISDELRKKRSLAMVGKYLLKNETPEAKIIRLQKLSIAASQPVMQFDKNGTFIKEYSSNIEATRALNHDCSRNICAASIGEQKTAYGFIWIRSNDFSESLLKDKLLKVKEIVPRPEKWFVSHDKLKVQIDQYDLGGNFIASHFGLRKISRELNTNMANLWRAAKTEGKTCRGYIWKYPESKDVK